MTEQWHAAQARELSWWKRHVTEELGCWNRDQFLGIRTVQAHVYLGRFGLDWHKDMYVPRSKGGASYIQGKLLDAGCSIISHFENVAGVQVIAFDPLLSRLRQALPQFVVEGKIHNCEYRCCTIQDIPETDFDAVWCYNVLDHSDDWQEIVRHFGRVLKPNGLLLVGVDVRTNENLLDTCHISAITHDALLETLTDFRIEWGEPHYDTEAYRVHIRARRI